MLREMVDWNGDWATPRGLASQMRPWSEQREWSGSSDAPRKAPSRNGNQPLVWPRKHTNRTI